MKFSDFLNSIYKIIFPNRSKVKIIDSFRIKYLLKKEMIIHLDDIETQLEVAKSVLIDGKYVKGVKVALVREYLPNRGYIPTHCYWPKYERFLKSNGFDYEYYDIHKSSWMEEAQNFDAVIWRVPSDPTSLDEAKTKIFLLENIMKKKCFPSYKDLWWYEHKTRASYIFEYFKFERIPTFITFSKDEALEKINSTEFPIITKIATGSGSKGVLKIDRRDDAKRLIQTSFSENGKKTYWKYIRQKGYIYFQKFINDSLFDLRIIKIGNKLLGYYRFPKEGDFKASGSGIVSKESLPEDAMRKAIEFDNVHHTQTIAIDFLFSKSSNEYLINEASIFISVETCEQLKVNGVPGYYEFKNDEFVFIEGRYWIQELSLAEFFKGLRD